jgi:hypothetical protein
MTYDDCRGLSEPFLVVALDPELIRTDRDRWVGPILRAGFELCAHCNGFTLGTVFHGPLEASEQLPIEILQRTHSMDVWARSGHSTEGAEG